MSDHFTFVTKQPHPTPQTVARELARLAHTEHNIVACYKELVYSVNDLPLEQIKRILFKHSVTDELLACMHPFGQFWCSVCDTAVLEAIQFTAAGVNHGDDVDMHICLNCIPELVKTLVDEGLRQRGEQ